MRALSMGNAQTAASNDFGAVHYNPAQLARLESLSFSTGLGIRFSRLALDGPRTNESADLPKDNIALHLGATIPFPITSDFELNVGFGMSIPMAEVTRVGAQNPDVPQFYRFDALSDSVVMAVALGTQIFDWLDLGVGVRILGYFKGSSELHMAVQDRRLDYYAVKAYVTPRTAPTVGFTAHPVENLDVAISYRSAIAFPYRIDVDARVDGLVNVITGVTGKSIYTPHEMTIGVQWRPLNKLYLVADLVGSLWSLSPDPSAYFTASITPEGASEARESPSLVPIILHAEDTLGLRIGFDTLVGTVKLRGGYGFLPTPLPTPAAQTNYADSDAHQLSFGLGYTLLTNDEDKVGNLELDLGGQITLLETRDVDKVEDENNADDYTIGGGILFGGFTLSYIR